VPATPPKLTMAHSTPSPYRSISGGSGTGGSSNNLNNSTTPSGRDTNSVPPYASTAAILSAHLGASDRALYSEPEASDVLLGDGYTHVRRPGTVSSATVTMSLPPSHTPALPPSSMAAIDTHAPLLAAVLGDSLDHATTPILPRSASMARMGLNPRSFTPVASSVGVAGATATTATDTRADRSSSIGYDSDNDNDIEASARPGAASTEPRVVRLAAGQRLFAAGAEANHVYVIINGKLHAYKDDDEVVGEISSGCVVGGMSFFGGTTRGETVKAAEATSLWELSREAFEQVLATRPHVCRAIYLTVLSYVATHLMFCFAVCSIASVTDSPCSRSTISASLSTIL
jgi:hypothetical protein